MKTKGTVFVGLSGGVDSSVAAALLKEQGYDVVGAFIKVWQPEFLPCTWKEDRVDAMRVAAHLDIPFHTFDFEKEYKEEVVDYMVREYKAGRTPNPDVMCNRSIKFGAFFDKAMEMGADYVATGHYARRSREFSIFNFQFPNNSQLLNSKKQKKYKLLKGKDNNKDQTYFLWTLTQRELSKTLFPIGEFGDKQDVRKKAEEFGLPTAQKKDSQGLCFVGRLDMRDFLKHFIPEEPGDVLDAEGKTIGRHEGACFYTIGQRHGFTIIEKGEHDAPYYVAGKDVDANTITVAHKADVPAEGGARAHALASCNWITGTPREGKEYACRMRYRQTPVPCRIRHDDTGAVSVVFAEPEVASPGQSLVLYDGEACAGGGIITA